jgi:hypothetical protein
MAGSPILFHVDEMPGIETFRNVPRTNAMERRGRPTATCGAYSRYSDSVTSTPQLNRRRERHYWRASNYGVLIAERWGAANMHKCRILSAQTCFNQEARALTYNGRFISHGRVLPSKVHLTHERRSQNRGDDCGTAELSCHERGRMHVGRVSARCRSVRGRPPAGDIIRNDPRLPRNLIRVCDPKAVEVIVKVGAVPGEQPAGSP